MPQESKYRAATNTYATMATTTADDPSSPQSTIFDRCRIRRNPTHPLPGGIRSWSRSVASPGDMASAKLPCLRPSHQRLVQVRDLAQPILETLANDRIVRLIGILDHDASIRRQLRANKGFVRSDNTKGIGIQPIKP